MKNNKIKKIIIGRGKDALEYKITGAIEEKEYQVVCPHCGNEYANLDINQMKFYCSECPMIRWFGI